MDIDQIKMDLQNRMLDEKTDIFYKFLKRNVDCPNVDKGSKINFEPYSDEISKVLPAHSLADPTSVDFVTNIIDLLRLNGRISSTYLAEHLRNFEGFVPFKPKLRKAFRLSKSEPMQMQGSLFNKSTKNWWS